jgi:hypothetical protein
MFMIPLIEAELYGLKLSTKVAPTLASSVSVVAVAAVVDDVAGVELEPQAAIATPRAPAIARPESVRRFIDLSLLRDAGP